MVGDKVALEVTEVIDHYGDTIVRARYDGEYDKEPARRAHPDQLLRRSRQPDRSHDRDPQRACGVAHCGRPSTPVSA
jgi:hypothetical protein